MKSSLMSPDFPIIIADESVDARIIRHLADLGYSVYSIMAETPGIPDSKVIAIAVEKNGYILTEDKDFGDELIYRKVHNIGSMLLRLSDKPIEARTLLIAKTLTFHADSLINAFSVLTSKKLRIRQYTT